MEPLCVVHIRLDSIGVIPWSVFSQEALVALREAVAAGEFGRASIAEFESKQWQLPEAA